MKEDIFIQKVSIRKVRDIADFDIKLSSKERRHLLITGKNGSGKTTLLLSINQFLSCVFNGDYKNWEISKNNLNNLKQHLDKLQNSPQDNRTKISNTTNSINSIENWLSRFGGLEISFSHRAKVAKEASEGNFLIAFFDAKRLTSLQIPTGINRVQLKDKYSSSEKAGKSFIQYIVNLKAERSFARDDGDSQEVARIDQWFANFEAWLRLIFAEPSLKLIFDRKEYNFTLEIEGKTPFDLTKLSDGYSAILSIVTELILRMEAIGTSNYGMQGVVLIDEIETHLHVDLQKKILPFLVDFFPNLQFIVTTHSPFVLSSIENSAICDLQDRIVTEDLSGYSYDALIESYFASDKYSQVLKEKVHRYEELSMNREEKDMEEYMELKQYFSSLPKYLSPELNVKLQQIELANLSKDRN